LKLFDSTGEANVLATMAHRPVNGSNLSKKYLNETLTSAGKLRRASRNAQAGAARGGFVYRRGRGRGGSTSSGQKGAAPAKQGGAGGK
jgi:hypothetical protein